MEIHGSIIRKCDNCGKETLTYCLKYKNKDVKVCKYCLKEHYNVTIFNTFNQDKPSICPKCGKKTVREIYNSEETKKGRKIKVTQFLCSSCANSEKIKTFI